jgi:putative ABC transport system permease protein
MRVYRALLRLYPAGFRAEYGEELCRIFATRLRDAGGAVSVLALWLTAAADVVGNAVLVHWDILRHDLRYTARTLGRAPGFAATAVLVTALGIGANTAVFSVTDHVLVRPLPYPDAHRLVKLWEQQLDYSRIELSPGNYRDWRRMSASFEAMAAYWEISRNLVGRGEPERVESAAVSADLLPLLGVRPLVGRLFTAEDDAEGAPGTVLLSYGLWQRLFGGGRDVVGATVRLDDETYTIVGVLPASFSFPHRETQVWTTTRFRPDDFVDRTNNYLNVLAMLKPGVSIEEARAEMAVVTGRLAQEYPREHGQTAANVITLRGELSRQSRLLLAALFGASFCVLLIACTNLANLLLARAMTRRREVTVRAALGAGRERLVRQLLTESLVLAALGGGLGVAAAAAAVPLLSALVPAALPIGEISTIDGRVLVFAAVLTTLTGIAFGVVPALRICSGTDLSGLREGARGGVGGRRQRLRSALVTAEVAASVVLLISSGLLLRALARIQATDPGFRADGVLAVATPLPMVKYGATARRAELYSRILSEVRALPGVTHAAYASGLPMKMRGGIWPVQAEGAPQEVARSRYPASLRFVTPDYFGALGIPLRRGRDVAESDTFEAPFVVVVSESLVRRHWPDQDPLGRRFTFAFRERSVVGVAADVRVRGLERDSEPQVYVPYKQVPDDSVIFYAPKELVIRSSSEPAPLAAAVREIVRKADPELPIADVRTIREVVAADSAPRLTQIRVLAAFAALAVLLAGLGLHGLLSFAVSQRVPEIGIRIALGAGSRDILGMVLRQAFVLAAIGGSLGLVLAYVAGRAMETLLAGVGPGDVVTFAAAAALALMMTLSGSLVPALRAVRVDPTTAIRAE